MLDNSTCPVCGSKALSQPTYGHAGTFFICPVCGRFELISRDDDLQLFDLNYLTSYLAYNSFRNTGSVFWATSSEYRYFTTLNKEECDEYKERFQRGDKTNGHPVHLSPENVKNWYPKTFAEKVDKTLLYLSKHTEHMGQVKEFPREELFSWLFVERYIFQNKRRSPSEMFRQADFMLEFLKQNELIHYEDNNGSTLKVVLSPKGYSRVDSLQKNTIGGKKVLIAMKFGDETKVLREKIRAGISAAGYLPELIDEVEHNEFITQELLKHIRESVFVVVDLTHQNNGAYFEEGYAMGLGKPVIQLCKKGVNLHFDIAQKNTIIWETEDDIPDRLKNRIIATID